MSYIKKTKLPIICFIFQDTNKNELVQQKSEISYFVRPNTQVSNERLSPTKTENISDEDELSLTKELPSKTKKPNEDELSITKELPSKPKKPDDDDELIEVIVFFLLL